MSREIPRASASCVTALFKAQALSFPLPAGATFADLADQLEEICVRTNDEAIAVRITVGSAGSGFAG